MRIDFLRDAVAQGAGALVVSRAEAAAGFGVPVFTVTDTLLALGALARLPAARVGRARNGGRDRRLQRKDDHEGAHRARPSRAGSRCTPPPAI